MADTFIQVADALPKEFRGVALKSSFVPEFFERYHDRYIEEPMSGCWLWTGSRTTSGYGNFTYRNKTHYAHRTSFESINGKGSSVGKVVRHRCDNPCCINPDHLLIGSPQDNVNDAWSRGRMCSVSGEDSGRAVLTENIVLSARRDALNGLSVLKIAEKYDVNRNTICSAITGETWSHLPGSVPLGHITKEVPVLKRGRGEGAANASLSTKDVLEIRERLSKGAIGRALAREYGVSPVTISAIKVRRIWSHV